MRNDEQDKLWGDILSDVAPTEFREALLNQTLGRVRRRKQMRRVARGVMVAAAVIVVSTILWSKGTKQTVQKPKPEVSTVELVSSRPSPPPMMVKSVPGIVELVSSSPSDLALVTTEPSRHDFRNINDDELLALTGGRPAALVRKGPHEAELLIVDAGGQSLITAGE